MRLADFLGEWRINREIVEKDGAVHRLSGSAQFSPEPDGMLYQEDGVLLTDTGAKLTASRVYHWREGAGGRIQVVFEDGRDFHIFDPDDTTPAADHWCDPDTYHVSYNFAAWPQWSSMWSVSGPRKDYRMKTQYRR